MYRKDNDDWGDVCKLVEDRKEKPGEMDTAFRTVDCHGHSSSLGPRPVSNLHVCFRGLSFDN